MDIVVEGYMNPVLHERTTIHEEHATTLNNEIDRLQTFDTWPVLHIQPHELARWGFYYTGSSDIVRCHFCKIELGNWEEFDVVTQEHLKWSRHCPLMRKQPTNNVPLDANFLDQLVDAVPDVTGSVYGPEWYTGEASGTQQTRTTAEYSATYEGETQSIPAIINQTALQPDSVPLYRPKFQNYLLETARLLSFNEWPKSMKQTPGQLADAGFFYTGKSDIVQCFCCGGALRDWMNNDDPWVEHAANFSGCSYVNLMKSPDFIRKCQRGAIANDNTPDQAEIDLPKDEGPLDDEVADDKSCKVCYTKPYDTVFMPCGHVVACRKCASSTTKCPLCNEPYTNILRIYLP